jgi:excinuclease ABC subunit C
LKSELESIPGIGDKTRIQLLQTFKSAQRVSFAKLDELEDIVGKSKAQKIYNFYNNKK